MSKLILLIALLLSTSFCVIAQSTDAPIVPPPGLHFEYEDECGNPDRESSTWASIEGTVIKIEDGDTIVVLTKFDKRKRVDLAAVDASVSSAAARRMLTELVLNREVQVLVSSSNIDCTKTSGVVQTPAVDVNRELIKAGVARYKKPKFLQYVRLYSLRV